MTGRVRFETGTRTALPALEPLLFELQQPGRSGRHVRGGDEADPLIPNAFRRVAPLPLPELSEPQVVRHYTHLAQLNYCLLDTSPSPRDLSTARMPSSA